MSDCDRISISHDVMRLYKIQKPKIRHNKGSRPRGSLRGKSQPFSIVELDGSPIRELKVLLSNLTKCVTDQARVAEVVRGHKGPSPKSLDFDKNFKP